MKWLPSRVRRSIPSLLRSSFKLCFGMKVMLGLGMIVEVQDWLCDAHPTEAGDG